MKKRQIDNIRRRRRKEKRATPYFVSSRFVFLLSVHYFRSQLLGCDIVAHIQTNEPNSFSECQPNPNRSRIQIEAEITRKKDRERERERRRKAYALPDKIVRCDCERVRLCV